MRHNSIRRAGILCVLILALFVGCDSNDNGAPDNFDIVGSWALTSLEGAPGPVDASNSTWTFTSDGTYTWFFRFPGFFDLQDSGTYSLQGRTLSVDGSMAQTVASSPTLELSLGGDTFSFRDDAGDRWTYRKQN